MTTEEPVKNIDEQTAADTEVDNEKILLKTLKSYFKLCSEAEDKRIFLKDHTFCTMLVTFVSDTRPLVVHYVAKILIILTEKSENAKLVYKIDGILTAIGDACDRYLPTRVLHNLLIVHSRLNVFKHRDINKQLSSKTTQLAYHLKDVSDGKQKLIEQACLSIRGVNSIGFTQRSKYVKCEVLVKESVLPKVIEKCILGCGYESILRIVKLDNGMTQAYDVYADELNESREADENETNLPKYLDEMAISEVDVKHGVVPQGYIHEEKSGWLGKLTSLFW